MPYPLACSSWTEEETNAAIDVIRSGKCTMGALVKEFETKFAQQFGSKYAVMSNSGSSANLLAIAALCFRNNGPKLEKGDEVIVPAVSWATTYYPLHQYGLKLKFVDIDPASLNILERDIENAIGPKTKAIFAVNLLGNCCNYDFLEQVCKKHNLILIEDNCESLGATHRGRQAGTIGLLGTYSSFFSHHICTIEGGVTVTNDEELYQIMISLRAHGWTRELPSENFVHNKDGVKFNDLFRFVLPGYNLRPNEIFAALGLCQLKKIPQLIAKRQENAAYFYDKFDKLKEFIDLQRIEPNSTSSYFGFAMLLKGKLLGRRQEVVSLLESINVDCRPIVAGNFAKNPVIQYMEHEIIGNLSNADYIDKEGLFIGNSHIDLRSEIDNLVKHLELLIER